MPSISDIAGIEDELRRLTREELINALATEFHQRLEHADIKSSIGLAEEYSTTLDGHTKGHLVSVAISKIRRYNREKEGPGQYHIDPMGFHSVFLKEINNGKR